MSRSVVGLLITCSSETKAADLPRQRDYGVIGGGSSMLYDDTHPFFSLKQHPKLHILLM